MGQTSISNLILRVPGLLKNLAVRAQDGSYLGRVVAFTENGLEIRSGKIAHRFYYVNYEDITSAFGGSLYLWKGSDALIPIPNQLTSQELNEFISPKVMDPDSNKF